MADPAAHPDPPRPAPLAPPWVRYGPAVAAVGVAATVNLAVRRNLSAGAPLLFFPAAIVVAALAGGYGAGLLATALSVLTAGRFVLDPPTPPVTGREGGLFLAL